MEHADHENEKVHRQPSSTSRLTGGKRPRSSDNENDSAIHQRGTIASASPPYVPPAVYYGTQARQLVKEEEVERILARFASVQAQPEVPQAMQSTTDTEMAQAGVSPTATTAHTRRRASV
jgi:hypothetical protein